MPPAVDHAELQRLSTEYDSAWMLYEIALEEGRKGDAERHFERMGAIQPHMLALEHAAQDEYREQSIRELQATYERGR